MQPAARLSTRSVAGRRLLVSVLPQVRLSGVSRTPLSLSGREGEPLLADENVDSLGVALRQLGAWRQSPEQGVANELLRRQSSFVGSEGARERAARYSSGLPRSARVCQLHILARRARHRSQHVGGPEPPRQHCEHRVCRPLAREARSSALRLRTTACCACGAVERQSARGPGANRSCRRRRVSARCRASPNRATAARAIDRSAHETRACASRRRDARCAADAAGGVVGQQGDHWGRPGIRAPRRCGARAAR